MVWQTGKQHTLAHAGISNNTQARRPFVSHHVKTYKTIQVQKVCVHHADAAQGCPLLCAWYRGKEGLTTPFFGFFVSPSSFALFSGTHNPPPTPFALLTPFLHHRHRPGSPQSRGARPLLLLLPGLLPATGMLVGSRAIMGRIPGATFWHVHQFDLFVDLVLVLQEEEEFVRVCICCECAVRPYSEAVEVEVWMNGGPSMAGLYVRGCALIDVIQMRHVVFHRGG